MYSIEYIKIGNCTYPHGQVQQISKQLNNEKSKFNRSHHHYNHGIPM